METQPKTDVKTRDIGVGCDLPLRYLGLNLSWGLLPSRLSPKRAPVAPLGRFPKVTGT